MKFGGSCLNKPNDIRRMVEIIKSAEAYQPKPVLSAFKGITDELLRQAKSAKEGNFELNEIEGKHQELLNDLQPKARAQVEEQIDKLINELRECLTQISSFRELTPPTLDRVLSYGEMLAIHISGGYLAEQNIRAVPLAGMDAGILTNSNFGNASIMEKSYELIRNRLEAVNIPLVAGFFGHDSAGRVATLGRGASDYVATFIGAAFQCKTILFKDVDGVMTADPKIVSNAKLIPNLNYQTAIELGRYGSKVVFEKAVLPAMKAKVPIEVKHFEKEKNGTTISNEGGGEATSYIKGICMVDVTRFQSSNVMGPILSELNAIYADEPIAVVLVSQNELKLVTNDSRAREISEIIKRLGAVINVDTHTGLSLVALIGKRLPHSQVLESLRMAGVEPLVVLDGPSGITTLSIVNQADTEASVRALHNQLL